MTEHAQYATAGEIAAAEQTPFRYQQARRYVVRPDGRDVFAIWDRLNSQRARVAYSSLADAQREADRLNAIDTQPQEDSTMTERNHSVDLLREDRAEFIADALAPHGLRPQRYGTLLLLSDAAVDRLRALPSDYDGHVTGDLMWIGGSEYRIAPPPAAEIPDDTREAIDTYAAHGYGIGGFLSAVLENNLIEAAFRADDRNGPALQAIAKYVDRHVPSIARGSQARVGAWMDRKASERKATQP